MSNEVRTHFVEDYLVFMRFQSEMNVLYEDNDKIEEKRRKNVIDNQNFLQSLQLFNVWILNISLFFYLICISGA